MNEVLQKEEQAVAPPPATRERPFVSPNVNIVETKEGYVLEAEMPGVAREGLEINLEENVLTITGRRVPDAGVVTLLYRESNPADYRRVFELSPSVESGKITAQIEQGILTLNLPKAEKAKPRRINVN
jgi:HSP20 family protein